MKRNILSILIAGAAIFGLSSGAVQAQTVAIDLLAAGAVVEFGPGGGTPVATQINNNQFNDGLVGTATTIDGDILFDSSGFELIGSQVEVNDNTVQGLAIGNNGTNAIFVGFSACVVGNGECTDVFDPDNADIQIGSAQVNNAAEADANVDGMFVGATFGTDTLAASLETDVEVNNNLMVAAATGNAVSNQILGDFSDLADGLAPDDATSTTDASLGVDAVVVDGNIVIANAQLNDGATVITADLGGAGGVPVVGGYDNFIGIDSNGDVTNIDGYDVLNNTAQALATGNDADNRIGGNLDGDSHSLVIASLQINQGGTTTTATATGMGIGILQGSDPGGIFTGTAARVSGNTIGSQSIGNNVTNVIGSAGIGN